MKVLLLAGTAEARELAAQMAAAEINGVASLAGAVRRPAMPDLPARVGGFGGAEGFADYVRNEGIGAVVDATHPFAHRISARSQRVCGDLGVPYLQLLRPAWQAGRGDNWREVDREEDVVGLIPSGATVFLATGRQTLERFAGLKDCDVIARQIDPPDGPFPFPGGRFLVGRPPFSVEDEVALFRDLGVDWLVVKNAGGAPSRSKLDAAKLLEIPVAMIARPPQPPGAKMETVEEAMAWLTTL
ncbi:cobalt-precorrin-6A reductase [Aestuariibius sp. 2305UL40-4]|uniref:cobalt-precorrin-6A reductase n=1 Tax=Aestuariibius violaceus TaxID=3234132 RepID=UPI00345E60E8